MGLENRAGRGICAAVINVVASYVKETVAETTTRLGTLLTKMIKGIGVSSGALIAMRTILTLTLIFKLLPISVCAASTKLFELN